MGKGKAWGPDILLLLLFLAFCGSVVLRVSVEATGYTSPDSEFYLELAQNLKDGRGIYRSNEYPIPAVKTPDNQVFFSAWPVGYPVLIFLVSEVSELDVFWASKAVNLLLLGLCLLLLRRLNRPYAFVLGSVYCAFTILEMHSYTWSEAAFMFGLLCFVYLLSQLLRGGNENRDVLLLFITCLYLFLVRYVGAFAIGVVALAAIWFWREKHYNTSKKLFLVCFSVGVFVGLYFGMNYLLGGSVSGGDRLARNTEGASQLLRMFAQGIASELLLIRHYPTSRPLDVLFLFATALQLVVVIYVGIVLKTGEDVRKSIRSNHFSHLCVVVAALYLLSLLLLRSISPFDFDYRLLSPFTYLVLMGLVHYVVALPESTRNMRRVKWLIFFFFLLSLLLNLPKQYLLERLLS